MAAAWAPKNSLMRPSVPQSAGDLTPAGGGRCLPIVLKTWPMKPSGVQFARPILPPGLHDADQLGGGAILIGREHDAEGRDDDVETGIGEGQGLGIGLAEFDVEPFGRRPLAPALEQAPAHNRWRRPCPSAAPPPARHCRSPQPHPGPSDRHADRGPRTALRRRSAGWCRQSHSRRMTRRPAGASSPPSDLPARCSGWSVPCGSGCCAHLRLLGFHACNGRGRCLSI